MEVVACGGQDDVPHGRPGAGWGCLLRLVARCAIALIFGLSGLPAPGVPAAQGEHNNRF
jgi:hypothetical protein